MYSPYSCLFMPPPKRRRAAVSTSRWCRASPSARLPGETCQIGEPDDRSIHVAGEVITGFEGRDDQLRGGQFRSVHWILHHSRAIVEAYLAPRAVHRVGPECADQYRRIVRITEMGLGVAQWYCLVHWLVLKVGRDTGRLPYGASAADHHVVTVGIDAGAT